MCVNLDASASIQRTTFFMFAMISRQPSVPKLEQTENQNNLKRITRLIDTEEEELGFQTRGTLNDQKRRRTMIPRVSPGYADEVPKPPPSPWYLRFTKSWKLKREVKSLPNAAEASVVMQPDTDEDGWSARDRESGYPTNGPQQDVQIVPYSMSDPSDYLYCSLESVEQIPPESGLQREEVLVPLSVNKYTRIIGREKFV